MQVSNINLRPTKLNQGNLVTNALLSLLFNAPKVT